MPRREAIIDACRKRARPIVMTTIAMSAGMIPASLALGDGGEFRAPMAIAVIGGLLASTLLSLVFVPALFTVMDDAAIGTTRLFRRVLKPTKRMISATFPTPPRPVQNDKLFIGQRHEG